MTTPLPKHVIIADDDEDDRLFVTEALQEIEVPTEVVEVSNGQELMEILHDPKIPLPDVVFLDLNMPLKNGLECLKEIREDQDEKIKNLNVVILSTSSNNTNIDQCYELGASYYSVKPPNYNNLKKLISKVLTMDWDCYNKPDRKQFVLSI